MAGEIEQLACLNLPFMNRYNSFYDTVNQVVSYGIEKGLMASMPIRTLEGGKWEVVQGVPVDAFSQGKIDLTIAELKEEREAVQGLIPA